MSFHQLLLVLLLLPSMCLLTIDTDGIIGIMSADKVDDCDLSYCLRNLSTVCNQVVFWKAKSVCVFLNCTNDSCAHSLRNLEKRSQANLTSQINVARPTTASPQTPATNGPPPTPPASVATGPSPVPFRDLRPQHISSSTKVTSLNSQGSSGNHSSSGNGQKLSPQVTPATPTINISHPVASLRPEAASTAGDHAQPDAPVLDATSSDNATTAGIKTTPQIKTTPEAPPSATTAAATNGTTTVTSISISTFNITTTTTTTSVVMTTTLTTAVANPSPSVAESTTVKVTPRSAITNATTEPAVVPKPTPSAMSAASLPPFLPSTHPVTPAGGQKPLQTMPKTPGKPTAGQPSGAEGKERDQAMVEAAGELTIHVVNTSSLLAVLMFGLLFFVVTIVLFLRHAYESYKRKDYTQVDYLINGMYSDSGV